MVKTHKSLALTVNGVQKDLGFGSGFAANGNCFLLPYKNSYWGLPTIALKFRCEDGEDFLNHAQVLDFAEVDPDLKGFRCSFHDGTYGYAVGGQTSEVDDARYWNGKIARFSLATFAEDTVEVLNMQSAMYNLRGHRSAWRVGHCAYAVSRDAIGRIDLRTFRHEDVRAVRIYESMFKEWVHSGFTDGARFGFVLTGGSSNVPIGRFDMEAIFPGSSGSDLGAFKVFWVSKWLPQLSGLKSGFFARLRAYFVDFSGRIARVEPETFQPDEWLVDVSLPPHSISMMSGSLSGSFTDGKYGYLLSGFKSGKDVVARLHLGTSEVETATFTSSMPRSTYTGFHDGRLGYILQYHPGSLIGEKMMKTLVQVSVDPSRKCVAIPQGMAKMYKAAFCPQP